MVLVFVPVSDSISMMGANPWPSVDDDGCAVVGGIARKGNCTQSVPTSEYTVFSFASPTGTNREFCPPVLSLIGNDDVQEWAFCGTFLIRFFSV